MLPSLRHILAKLHPPAAVLIAMMIGLASPYARCQPIEQPAPADKEQKNLPEDSAALNHRASELVRNGQYKAALPFARRAMELDLQDPGHSLYGTIISMQVLADIYVQLDMREAASDVYKKALALTEGLAEKDVAKRADILDALAELAGDAGDLNQTLSLYLRALNIRERVLGKDHFLTGLSQANVAGMYMLLGQDAQARQLLQAALGTLRQQIGDDVQITMDTAIDLAYLTLRMGGKNEILPLLQKKLAVKERLYGPSHPDVAAVLADIARWQRNYGSLQQALALQQRSVQIHLAAFGPEHATTVSGQLALADIHLAMGDLQQARPLLVGAIGSPAVARSPWQLMETEEAMSALYEKSGDRELAAFFAKMAANALQGLRTSSVKMAYHLQENFFKRYADLYERLATMLFKAGRDEEGRQVFAMLKEDEYRKLSQPGSSARYLLLQPVSYTAAEQPWGERFKQLFERNKGAEDPSGQAQPAERERRDGMALIDALQADLPRQQRLLQEQDARQLEALQKWQQMQIGEYRRHGKRTALVRYQMLGDTLRISVIRDRKVAQREIYIPQDILLPAIRAFRKTLETPSLDPRPISQELHKILLLPVMGELDGVATLMLVADGALRYMPFAALYDGRRYLIERFSLDMQTGGRIAKWHESAGSARHIALFGTSKAIAEFPALPGAKKEILGIAAHSGLGSRIFMDERFTAEQLKNALQDEASLLHIASHFQLAPQSDMDSFLLLGDRTRLSLKDLQQGDFQFGKIDLLALSACSTALPAGFDAQGNEAKGLAELAQTLGAKSVIATLWAINDASTELLMRHFYAGLASAESGTRIDKAVALQRAQLALLKRGGSGAGAQAQGKYAHPYYWSAFILAGDWL
ncbi:CHAT domain-containing protein [Herbaspirillum sp.]|uniref:CHAT domain-containing tetratricopeptide repeat protein n=1 Tax=Herbaspirillum sp. TaxID=1890675 RepID=UPI0031DB23DF